MLIAAVIGFLFGFIGSMPVAGPIAMLVFARGVDNRFRSALWIATGGALAEACYAFLAFWGFSTLLVRYSFVVPLSRGVAAAVLMTLGLLFVRRNPPRADAPKVREAWGGSFLLGLTITALNPTLIATWTAAATTLFSTGLVHFTPAMALPFALGACTGIVGWFAVLLQLVHRYRGRFRAATLTRVIRVMGVFLIGLGLWFFGAFVYYLLRH